jgi:multiple sugar transport system permease protein
MKNTLGVSVAATAISLVFSVLAGYALARLRFRGAGLLGLLIFVSYLVPQTLLFIPLYDVIVSLGLTNTPWSLVLTYPTFLIPFCAWLLMGYFKSIPKELEESALIDGSSRLGTIWRIVLPLALPGLLSAGIFAFTLSWNEYLYALVFITDPALKTVAVGAVSELIRGDGFFWGELMAGALLACLPVAAAYAFLVDYYVAGLTAGAVKG